MLEEWFGKNKKDPYPSFDEKMLLCGMTGLSFKQITNWFINRRSKLPSTRYRKKLAKQERPHLIERYANNFVEEDL